MQHLILSNMHILLALEKVYRDQVYVPVVLGEVWGDGGGVLDCRAPTAA